MIRKNGGWTSAQAYSVYKNDVLSAGYQFDSETGLYCVRFRYYHPKLGTWLQRDPLMYINGMSMYEYCMSRPIIGVDPLGLGGLTNG